MADIETLPADTRYFTEVSAPSTPPSGQGVLYAATDGTLHYLNDAATDLEIGSGGGSAGTPATTVEDETTFGVSAAVGTDTEYARQDHTHGTPATPSLDTLSDVDTDKSKTPADGDVLTFDGTDWNAEAGGGGGGAPTDAEYLVTAADGDLSAERVVDLGATTLLQRAAVSETEDDDFNAGSLDAKWLAYTGNDATVSLAAGDGWAAITVAGAKLQAVPGGGWASVEAEIIGPDYLSSGYGNNGLILTSGTTHASATDCRWGLGGDNNLGTKRFVAEKFVNGSYSLAYAQTTGQRNFPQRYRLRIVKSGSTYYFDYAFGDGDTWVRYASTGALGFTPTHFGFYLGSSAKINYFRVTT